MIHYHGVTISSNSTAAEILSGRHAMVSFAKPTQLPTVAAVCQSFALDNGAFSIWKHGGELDPEKYYRFVETWKSHPGFDWCIIPDTIEGSEDDNRRMVDEWPFGKFVGVPVWHLHESLDYLEYLAINWPRLALGSSGKFRQPGSPAWWERIVEAMEIICEDGQPRTKIHGLRMLAPAIFTKIPFASCDSTMVAQNIARDRNWFGQMKKAPKEVRGFYLTRQIESHNSAAIWDPSSIKKQVQEAQTYSLFPETGFWYVGNAKA